jgi:hypothetical protein
MADSVAAPSRKEMYTVVPGQDPDRQPVFSVLVKRTYDIGRSGTLVRAPETLPFRVVDEYYENGDAEWTSIKHETEDFPWKVATDVVFIGRAHTPDGEPLELLDVALAVAGTRKIIRVIGDRQCEYTGGRPSFTDPVLFTEMDIRYERAYGGRDSFSIPGLPFYYPRNFVGTGMVIANTEETVQGLKLPNLEDPMEPITPDMIAIESPENWNAQPMPQGFGWFHRAWYPRCSFVGAYPPFVKLNEVLREEDLGLVPENQIVLARQMKLPSFDVRFNNGASAGLQLPYLSGDEHVTLTHLTREPEMSFRLPGEVPAMTLDIGFGETPLEPVLHTVSIDGEQRKVDLIWRGALPYPGVDWLPEMKRLVARVS